MRVRIDGMAWLSKSELDSQQIINIKNSLTLYPKKTTDISTKKDPDPIFMYDERDNEIGVPREWYRKKSEKTHEEILNVCYGKPIMNVSTRYEAKGHYEEQLDALRVLGNAVENRHWGGVFLKASCGFGKTSCVLEFARRLGRKTLILVHQDFFLDQWEQNIKYLMPEARIGKIKQSKCDYHEKDFVIGMLQSLVKDNGKYPEEIYKSEFGTIISDEMHVIGAPGWSRVIQRFSSAWRCGLTATEKRKDGAHVVFLNHVGEITYSAKTESQVPKLRTLETHSRLREIRRGSYRVPSSRLNSAQVLTQLANDEFRTKEISDQIVLAVQASRKVMVVSERLEQLKRLSQMLLGAFFKIKLPFIPMVDYYTGEWFSGDVWEYSTKTHKKGSQKLIKRKREDLRKAESANVILATKQLIEMGFDLPAIDVLVLATPMSDIEQVVGRVRRWCVAEEEKCLRLCPWRAGKCKEKQHPIVMDVVDIDIPRLMSKWNKRKQFYRSIGTI